MLIKLVTKVISSLEFKCFYHMLNTHFSIILGPNEYYSKSTMEEKIGKKKE